MIIRNGFTRITTTEINKFPMKIISIKKGFAADHSSTSYEFYAIDKVLDTKEKAAVSRLSSRVNPTGRRASFIYHGEWSDLPGGWQPLMEKYYDVMWSESYDLWTLAIAWNTDMDTIQILKQFSSQGADDMGINVYNKKNRVIISIDCELDILMEDERGNMDTLLNLLEKNREYLMKEDYRLLSGIIKKYGEDIPGNLPESPQDGKKIPEETRELLSSIDFSGGYDYE